MLEDRSYPALRFLLKFGNAIAIFTGAITATVGLWLAIAGMGWWWVPIGIAAGLFLFLLLRSYYELVQVIADTLLPQ